jgi:hypothetical protein
MATGSEIMRFIPVSEIPRGIIPTYMRIVAAWRPEKSNPYRIRCTVGGDRIEYTANASTKTADLTTAKLLFNSILSTPNAKFAGLDIKDYYLNTIMSPEDYAYMRIPTTAIPASIMEFYELDKLGPVQTLLDPTPRTNVPGTEILNLALT